MSEWISKIYLLKFVENSLRLKKMETHKDYILAQGTDYFCTSRRKEEPWYYYAR